LAGAGQASPEELAEFQSHVQECSHCRDLHEEFLEINSFWLSQATELEPEMYGSQSVLRRKILTALQGAGANFSEPLRNEITASSNRIRLFSTLWAPAPAWAVAALALVAAIVGFGVGTHRQLPQENSKIASRSMDAPVPSSTNADRRLKDPSEAPAQSKLQADLEQSLAASESQRTLALTEIQSLKHAIDKLQSGRDRHVNQIAQLEARSEQDKNAAQSAHEQIRALKEAEDAKNVELIATQGQLRGLETKLADQHRDAERERALAEVSSSSEMRDVIASRNLHIIDVADVTNSGLQKPFGRIFYTEGKSLIFYAYDLAGAKGAKTFYAWGHREGDNHTTRALGSLHIDDPAQRRWVFKCNDAKVLTEIDSVYVTLEPNARPGEKPRGDKILTAYLGTPANHP
jgi:hypothetical protein